MSNYQQKWITRNGQRVLQFREWVKTNARKRAVGDSTGAWSEWRDVPG